MDEQTAVSDYEAVGGGPAITVVVDDFYQRVLADPELSHYFHGVDIPRLKRHQVLMVTKVLGGSDRYNGRPLDEAHRGLGITEDHFDLVVGHLAAALTDAGVPDEIVARAGAAVVATKPDIVESR